MSTLGVKTYLRKENAECPTLIRQSDAYGRAETLTPTAARKIDCYIYAGWLDRHFSGQFNHDHRDTPESIPEDSYNILLADEVLSVQSF